MNTDEHRWTQIFRGVAKLYPSRLGEPFGVAFRWSPQKLIICVYLRPSVVEKVHSTPQKGLNFVRQNLRKPQQNPTSSTLVTPKYFLAPARPARRALTPILHRGFGGRGQNRRSAGFQTCRIADFQIGRVSQWRGGCGFGNPRYSRLGSLRHKIARLHLCLSVFICGLKDSFQLRRKCHD